MTFPSLAERYRAGVPKPPLGYVALFLVAILFVVLVIGYRGLLFDASPGTYLQKGDESWEVLTQGEVFGAPVKLPFRLPEGAKAAGTTEIRLPISVKPEHQQDVPLGICFTRIVLSAEFVLDGVVVARTAAGHDEVLDYSRPQYLALPIGLLPGEHDFRVRLHSWPGLDGGVSEAWFGEGIPVSNACALTLNARRTRIFGSTVLLGAMGLIALVMGIAIRERGALYFAATALLWVFHLRNFEAPVTTSVDLWVLIVLGSRNLFLLPLILYLLEVAGRPTRRVAQWLLAIWLPAVFLLPAVQPAFRSDWVNITSAFAEITLVLSLMLLGSGVWRAGRVFGPTLLLTVSLIAFGVMADHARWLGLTAFSLMSVSYRAVPLLTLSFAALLLETLLAHRNRERLALELQRSELEKARAEITQEQARLRLEGERLARQEERRQVMQDMHDGMGSQLVAAATLLSHAEPSVAQAARAGQLVKAALLEMRVALDVLALADQTDPQSGAVTSLLGNLRQRMTPVLEAVGVRLLWSCDVLPGHFLPEPSQRIHLLRLLQEALTNVVKHAAASEVEIRISALPSGAVSIVVHDNGRGFHERAAQENKTAAENADGSTEGKQIGMRSMHMRARAIGAALHVDSTPGTGVRVALQWDEAGSAQC